MEDLIGPVLEEFGSVEESGIWDFLSEDLLQGGALDDLEEVLRGRVIEPIVVDEVFGEDQVGQGPDLVVDLLGIVKVCIVLGHVKGFQGDILFGTVC